MTKKLTKEQILVMMANKDYQERMEFLFVAIEYLLDGYEIHSKMINFIADELEEKGILPPTKEMLEDLDENNEL